MTPEEIERQYETRITQAHRLNQADRTFVLQLKQGEGNAIEVRTDCLGYPPPPTQKAVAAEDLLRALVTVLHEHKVEIKVDGRPVHMEFQRALDPWLADIVYSKKPKI